MEGYEFTFGERNNSSIIIRENGKIINFFACPSIDKGIDIITFGAIIQDSYTFNFKGLILITTPSDRKLYYLGDLIAETKR